MLKLILYAQQYLLLFGISLVYMCEIHYILIFVSLFRKEVDRNRYTRGAVKLLLLGQFL